MSSLIVEVCKIEKMRPHPTPGTDRMVVAKVKGWDVCIGKKEMPDGSLEPWCKEGDKVVYFPPECILNKDTSEKFNVTKYLTEVKDEKGNVIGGRVRAQDLRGFKSYGFCGPLDNPDLEVGTSLVDYYGVTKWQPVMTASQGDGETPHPAFHAYYDMENVKNFPNTFASDEEVICTEKIHGENSRIGLIRIVNDNGVAVWNWMAGTHTVRRKQFYEPKPGIVVQSRPWYGLNHDAKLLLAELSNCGYTPEELDQSPPVKDNDNKDIVIFQEVYGPGVQKSMHYGLSKIAFCSFDISVNGKYLDFDIQRELFAKYGVPMVPVIYRGPFDIDKIAELAELDSCVSNLDKDNKKFKEGLVIKTTKETPCMIGDRHSSRKQMKYISFNYVNDKKSK